MSNIFAEFLAKSTSVVSHKHRYRFMVTVKEKPALMFRIENFLGFNSGSARFLEIIKDSRQRCNVPNTRFHDSRKFRQYLREKWSCISETRWRLFALLQIGALIKGLMERPLVIAYTRNHLTFVHLASSIDGNVCISWSDTSTTVIESCKISSCFIRARALTEGEERLSRSVSK